MVANSCKRLAILAFVVILSCDLHTLWQYRWLWFSCLWTILTKYVRNYLATRLRPVLPTKTLNFSPGRDISVVVPTIRGGLVFRKALLTWIATKPLEIIIIIPEGFEENLIDQLKSLTETVSPTSVDIRTLTVSQPGKRRQLARGILAAKGSILVLVDDDVFWPPTLLEYILPCFQDPQVGGVGTRQRGNLDPTVGITTWERIGARRLSKRNTEISATNYIEPAVTCLSGRTAAYRADILQSPLFVPSFLSDYWVGLYLLDSGDDTFLTRFLLRHGWKIQIQTHEKAEVTTSVEATSVFLLQVLRWSRNTKRSYLRHIFLTPRLWRKTPCLLAKMALALLHPFRSIFEYYILGQAMFQLLSGSPQSLQVLMGYLLLRILVLLLDFIGESISIDKTFFSGLALDFFMPLVDLYAFVTLHQTSWGSRDIPIIQK